MTFSPRKSLSAAGAALALSLGWSAVAGAAPVVLTPCDGDELAGEWLVLYQLRQAEYCKLTLDETGLITDATCYSRKGRPLRAEMSGKLVLDATCAVRHDGDPIRLSKLKGKGNGKYGKFKVETQLSEDRSTMVGLFRFRTHLSHVTAQRIDVPTP
ncbi:hypothetical protein [Microbaculum sp. FT89]|uniref:hypothetical protein n=1 Tax=Microbaculum sp. FT89 TaxID=3447298 RepID=UPI003F52EFC7